MRGNFLNAAVAVTSAIAVIATVGIFITLDARSSTPTQTPTHVVAVFVDGFNHADFRQLCSVSQLPHGSTLAQCEQFYAGQAVQASFFGVWGGYKVVPHSYKGWREGSVKVARVEFQYAPKGKPAGQVLTARLVKTAHGWKVSSVR